MHANFRELRVMMSVKDQEQGAELRGAAAPMDGHRWSVTLRRFLLAVALLAALSLLTRPSDVWTSDEGAVRAQVEVLHTSGAWSVERPFAEIDPEEVIAPIHGASIDGDRYYPYTKHAILPLALAPLRSVGGDSALIALSLVASVVAALGGSAVASRIDPKVAAVSFWVLVVFTPLLLYGFTVLGHTPAVAAVAWLVVITLDHRARISPWWIAASGLTGVAVLFRAEAALFAVGMALVLVTIAVRSRHLQPLILGFVIAVSAVSGVLANRWLDAILGGATPEEGEAIVNGFRFVSGAFSSLILVGFGTPLVLTGVIMMVAGAALCWVAVVREPGSRVLHWAFASVSLLGSAIIAAVAPVAVGGLAAACPFLVCGLLVLPDGLRRNADVQFILASCIVFVGLVLITQDGAGGGVQWGGRYLLLMVPAVGPVAISALWDAFAANRRRVAPAVLALAVASVVLSVDSLWVLNTGRANSATMSERLAALSTQVSDDEISGMPVVMSTHTQIGRHAWRHIDTVAFLMIPATSFETYLERFAMTRSSGFGYFGAVEDRIEPFTDLGYVVTPGDAYPYFMVEPAISHR